ncbi:MAG TPA: hypothetical protein VFB96_15385 [Pirellulaceae bacterium]|nr:hypothetical protein [Pirellulaceae bacterium]
MKQSLLGKLVIAGSVLACGSAAAEGWKMPNLNPFKKKDSHPAHLRVTDDASKNSSWWKPKLPSKTSATERKTTSTPAKPSTWTKVTSGSRNAWTKTKDALNPFDDEKDKPNSVTGYHSPISQASTRKKPESKSSWWPSWGSEPEKKPKTVQDFLGQPRPDY